MKRIRWAAALIAMLLFVLPDGNLALAQYSQQGDGFFGGDGELCFGGSVSVSADGNTAIVGSPVADHGVGAAWIYTRSSGVWSQQGVKLVGTGNAGSPRQGTSVCISGDGNTVIVGGHADDGLVGAAWVFVRSGGTWIQQGNKLVGSGAVGVAYMGEAVALSGDGNTAIVGGGHDDGKMGAVWIFTRSNGVWSQAGDKLVGTDGIGGQFLGCSVALSEDGNTAIAGAWNYHPPLESGTAWVFVRSDTGWVQQGERLVGSGAVVHPGQGWSVALSADGNTAIVGGPLDNSLAGAAWVFTRSEGVWTQQGDKLVGTGGAYDPHQGSSVSLSRDGNTAIVGGNRDNGTVGATWVFARSGGVWTQQGEKLVGHGSYNDVFQGTSVDISADGNTIIAGGFNNDSGLKGAVWMFHKKVFGNLEVTVFDADGQGKPGASARAVLYSDSVTQVAEAVADTNSAITFSNLPEGYHYTYQVFAQSGTPWGELFYGQKTDVAIDREWIYDTFSHNTPYIADVEIYVDSTNEHLSAGGQNAIPPGTRVRIEVLVKNPSSSGSLQANALCVLILDRDTAAPYDIGLETSHHQLNPGEDETFRLYAVPTGEGEYSLSIAARGSASSYHECVTDADAWKSRVFRVKNKTVPPPWFCANTGTSHTIVVPFAVNPAIGGIPLGAGDYIGVFYDSSGTLACGGQQCWTGAGNIAVSAFGNDSTTGSPDGFASGEVFKWKFYRASDGKTFDAQATYEPVTGVITHTGVYASNGISQLQSLQVLYSAHKLSMRKGWSLISSYVAPETTSLDTIFKGVINDLIILKNGVQHVFMPSMSVNTVGPWMTTEGYQTKMDSAGSVVIAGLKIVPENVPGRLPVGWSIFPYVRDRDTSIVSVLGGAVNDIFIVKDQEGRAYVPSMGIDGIGALKVGQAYQIKMKNAGTIGYPAKSGATTIGGTSYSACSGKRNSLVPPWYYTNAGVNHTVIIPGSMIPTIDGTPLVAGDFVGAFYDSGATLACAGYEAWTGSGPIAVSVFGDDATTSAKDGFATGEPFRWKIWRQSDDHAFVASASYIAPGGLGGIVTDTCKYSSNGITALYTLNGSVVSVNEEGMPTEFTLMQNYPNPFNPSTTIRYGLPNRSHVTLTVFNTLGQEVALPQNGEQEAGYHEVQFDGRNLSSGVYFYRIVAGDFVQTRKLHLIR